MASGVREVDQFLSPRGASRCCAHMQRGYIGGYPHASQSRGESVDITHVGGERVTPRWPEGKRSDANSGNPFADCCIALPADPVGETGWDFCTIEK